MLALPTVGVWIWFKKTLEFSSKGGGGGFTVPGPIPASPKKDWKKSLENLYNK